MPKNRVKRSKKDEMRYVELGLNIAHYRKLCGFTQDELAEKIGITRGYLSQVEAQNKPLSPSIDVIFRIADALEVEPYQLFKLLDK